MKNPTLSRLFGANLIILLIFSGAFNPCYGQVDLNSGLIAYYPFNGNANDVSGNNLNPTNIVGVSLTTDRFGNANSAYNFDGNGHILVKDYGRMSQGKFTITYYFYTERTTTQIAIGKINYSNGNGAGYNTGVYSNIGFNAYFNVIDENSACNQRIPSTLVYTNFSSITIKPLTWYCMVCVFEDGVQSIYINGTLVGRRTQTFKNAKYCDNTDFIIGSWWSGDPNGFKGKLDEIRYYDRALNEQEIMSFCETTPMNLCSGVPGEPLININFGQGAADQQPLEELIPGASSSLDYLPVSGYPATPAPGEGQYTISNNVPGNSNWYSGKEDHTPGDISGNMMFINSSANPGEFYKQKISGLCGETTYEFAAWVSNVVNPFLLEGIEPDLLFIIEDNAGNRLSSYSTGGIAQNIEYGWKQYGFLFKTPSSVDEVVLKIINNRTGQSNFPGNDFAIDDITFRSCNSMVQASFKKYELIDSIVKCAGSSIDLFVYTPTENSSAINYWQYSEDNGVTWISPDQRLAGDQRFTLPATLPEHPYHFRIITIQQESNDNNYCRGISNVIKVYPDIAPSGLITANDICAGDNAIIKFTASTGKAPFTIEYSDGNNLFKHTGVSLEESFEINEPLFKTASYSLIKITDANGCTNTEDLSIFPATLNVNPTPEIVFAQPESFCNNVIQVQYLNAFESNGLDGRGVFRGTGISGDGAFQPSLLNTGFKNITYSYTSTEGCEASVSRVLEIKQSPQLNLETDLLLCYGFKKELHAGSGAQFEWLPNIGLSDPTISNPIITVTQDIVYTVTVTETNGCSAKDTIAIKAIPNSQGFFKMPNAFTPNGDGKNDCIGIQHWGDVTLKEFTIYNRWGQIIFSTTNPLHCWNGIVNGSKSEPGTYVYKIQAATSCGEVSRHGTITLIK